MQESEDGRAELIKKSFRTTGFPTGTTIEVSIGDKLIHRHKEG